ncbi:LysR family transcriptional regulator [Thermanaerosceptrum fracticalcis]|uniref:LysR family transcriptional regulator n=1 Tax=Thermanaerosceptrum fracticalcis TaxID=1712410 RepID=A0A7G6E1U3_THEFR|nr:selenium metabolism-associated LysR family transcriptional regulator [Thermanaerosceptrum fracticalcis]QNB46047.1 LysR family transcriptional regulator [Thermanaerosceptrum fracticalcis]
MLDNGIKVFLTVVEKKSFSKAAKALFLTQPAVSFQIQMLEEYYGTRLFDRVNRTINLTAAGELLLKYANEMSILQAQLEREMQELTGKIRGKLIIGASTTIGEWVLPIIVGSFKKKHSDVELSLEIHNTEDIEHRLLEGELDIGFVEGPVHGKEIVKEKFIDDELVLVIPPGHPLSKKEEVSVSDFVNYPFILREKGSGTRVVMEKALDLAGYPHEKLDVIMEIGSTSAILEAVQKGLGISLVSKFAGKARKKAGFIDTVNIKDLKFHREFTLIYHRKKFRTQAVEEFLKYLRSEEVRQLLAE